MAQGQSSPAQPMGKPRSLADVSVDEINATYKAGYITAASRNEMIQRKAKEVLENDIRNQGMLKTYFTETVKHWGETWNEFVKLVDDYKPASSGSEKNKPGGAINESLATLNRAKSIVMLELQAITAPFTAFGDVNGAVAEHWANSAGVSPGAAKVIGLAVNVGSNFVPVGSTAKWFAKSVRKNVPEIAAAVGKIAGGAKAAGEATAAGKLAS